MLLYYFMTVPELPYEVHHQLNAVEIVEYVAKEGQAMKAATPVLIVENWWAVMEILAAGGGLLARNIFDSRFCLGGHVQVGDPIALVLCDPEDAPHNKNNATIRVKKIKREKPKRR